MLYSYLCCAWVQGNTKALPCLLDMLLSISINKYQCAAINGTEKPIFCFTHLCRFVVFNLSLETVMLEVLE